MTPYSQRDPRWASDTLGNRSGVTIGGYGCVITSLGMMADQQPDRADLSVLNEGGFQGALVIWSVACQALGLAYTGSGTAKPSVYPAIAWTDYFAKQGYSTHYFVVLNDHTIIDPLDGKTKPYVYPIKGYQYIHPTGALSMDERTELNQLRALVADLKAGKVNEYLLPDGTIKQVLNYLKLDDYHAMGCDEKFLIQVPENFDDEVRALRIGGFQP